MAEIRRSGTWGSSLSTGEFAAIRSTVESGMPWQITSFTEVHSDFGKPR